MRVGQNNEFEMNYVIYTQFGSHVYGTDLPTSDLDFKAIYLPEPRDIVLQRVKPTIHENSKKGSERRNRPDEVDIETFSLAQYLKLLMEGQTVALDILFTPLKFHRQPPHPVFEQIFALRDQLISSSVAAFVGYTKQQAAKYGIKGSRMRAVKDTIEFLSQFDGMSKLGAVPTFIEFWIPGREHICITECKAPNGKIEPHLEVVNRKYPYHATVKYVLERLNEIYAEYGERARQAEKNEGIDWKALMHAVRVAHEARELLSTCQITFPRPERELLLRIRKGEMPYKKVAEIIEQGLESLGPAQEKSILRSHPDPFIADQIVFQAYKEVLRGGLF